MDGLLPKLMLETSHASSLSSTAIHKVGLESTAALIAQQQLNDARKAFLASANLSANHDFRRRANQDNGTLLLVQPGGAPRKAYDHQKVPKPRVRKYKEAATYFLERQQLMNMWNGHWTKPEDWAAWDATKNKMKRLLGNYGLVEKPLLRRGRAKDRQKYGRKPQRDPEISEVTELRRKRCYEKTSNPARPLPSPAEVLALIPPESISIEKILEKFIGCEGYDTERLCIMLHDIGCLDNFTRMFNIREPDMGSSFQKISPTTGRSGDILVEPALLKIRSARASTEDSMVGFF